MAEYAPDALRRLFDAIQAGIPSAINSGIIGDSAHTYGYHRGRDYVSPGDYSAEHPEDLGGDGQAACGLDLSWGEAGPQFDVSARLLAAAQAGDPRLSALRSFFGSVDGVRVIGWDLAENTPATSDDSHLWHVHMSVHRESAGDWAALEPVAQVITGGGASPAPDPVPSLLEVGMFLLWTSGGVMLVGAGYSKGLDGEEYAQAQHIPGIQTLDMSGNDRAADLILSACMNGSSAPPAP
jgi:hypothetical protein